MVKRVLDIVLASACLVMLAPLLLVVAALVRRESPGPVIYRGRRIGQHGVPFDILKFRTMRETPESYRGPRITAQDDPRVTRLGRFLRDSKLNELPQLFNVLRGDMSIVGPRPEDPAFVECYSEEEREVLAAKPGITGMSVMVHVDEERILRSADAAEVYLRSIMPSKLRIERVYVRNQTLLLDLDIILRTLVILVPRLRRRATIAGLLDGPVQRSARALVWYVADASLALAALAVAGRLSGAAAAPHATLLTALGLGFLVSLLLGGSTLPSVRSRRFLLSTALGAGAVALADALPMAELRLPWTLGSFAVALGLALGARRAWSRMRPEATRQRRPDAELIAAANEAGTAAKLTSDAHATT